MRSWLGGSSTAPPPQHLQQLSSEMPPKKKSKEQDDFLFLSRPERPTAVECHGICFHLAHTPPALASLVLPQRGEHLVHFIRHQA